MGKKRFTLIEFLVAITIITLIAIVSFVVYTSSQQKARDTLRLSDIQSIKKAVHLQYTDAGEYPSSDELAQIL